jgi:hypothetical protein
MQRPEESLHPLVAQSQHVVMYAHRQPGPLHAYAGPVHVQQLWPPHVPARPWQCDVLEHEVPEPQLQPAGRPLR